MYDKQVSATATNFFMLAAAMLLFAGQSTTGYSAGRDDALAAWFGGEPAVMCHMPVGVDETYGDALSRTLYESEVALVVPYDAPDCAA